MNGGALRIILLFAGIRLLPLAMGCGGPATGGGVASSSETSSHELSYSYLYSSEGLKVLLVDDMHDGSRSSSPLGPTKGSGHAKSQDGRGYQWDFTAGGGKAAFRLDGKEYDPSKGNVFLIKTTQGKNEVQQLQRDLSAIPSSPAGDLKPIIRELISKDGEITKALGPAELKKEKEKEIRKQKP